MSVVLVRVGAVTDTVLHSLRTQILDESNRSPVCSESA